jgi:hypothetical protein
MLTYALYSSSTSSLSTTDSEEMRARAASRDAGVFDESEEVQGSIKALFRLYSGSIQALEPKVRRGAVLLTAEPS